MRDVLKLQVLCFPNGFPDGGVMLVHEHAREEWGLSNTGIDHTAGQRPVGCVGGGETPPPGYNVLTSSVPPSTGSFLSANPSIYAFLFTCSLYTDSQPKSSSRQKQTPGNESRSIPPLVSVGTMTLDLFSPSLIDETEQSAQ